MVRYHIIVHGFVQGVGFRYFVQNNAMMNHIKGWVKNKGDGTVEMDVQGEEAYMKRFLNAVKRGNSFSVVEHVDVKAIPHIEDYRTFFIKY